MVNQRIRSYELSEFTKDHEKEIIKLLKREVMGTVESNYAQKTKYQKMWKVCLHKKWKKWYNVHRGGAIWNLKEKHISSK